MSEDKKTNGTDVLTARSALLDYYGDKAVSFGSLFVASIFGLVTILAIVQGINPMNKNPAIAQEFPTRNYNQTIFMFN